jgi:hypothetical protein
MEDWKMRMEIEGLNRGEVRRGQQHGKYFGSPRRSPRPEKIISFPF